MINDKMDEIDHATIENNNSHIISSGETQLLDEETLQRLGFDDGDIEMLGMLKDINPTICNMEAIKQNYMDIIRGRSGQSELSVETIIDSNEDIIPGTNITKHNISTDVLTIMINEINGSAASGVSMGGKAKSKKSKRHNKITKRHKSIRKRKRIRTNKRRQQRL